MVRKILMGLGAFGLAAAATLSLGACGAPQAKVICCGQCKKGDNCLEKCQVIGEVPKGTKLSCCGNCAKGNDCLVTCVVK